MVSFPKISVVTVCYNAVAAIENTILSVLNQTYPNIEYIIIDGASTDGTVDIVKKYLDKITYFVSEPDKGIYDAMNKGVDVATGEWINFMNSGDSFATDHTISDIFGRGIDYEGQDVIYGDTLYVYSGSPILYKAKPLSTLEYRMAFCHQSSYVRTHLLKLRHFDLHFKYVADYDFFHHLYINGHSFHYFSKVMTNYSLEGGFTNLNALNVAKEENLISQKKDMKWLRHLIYTYQSVCLHQIVPQMLLNKFRKFFVR